MHEDTTKCTSNPNLDVRTSTNAAVEFKAQFEVLFTGEYALFLRYFCPHVVPHSRFLNYVILITSLILQWCQ